MKNFKVIVSVIVTTIVIAGGYYINKNDTSKVQLSEQQSSNIYNNILKDKVAFKENNQIKVESLLSGKREINVAKVDSVTSATKHKENKSVHKQEKSVHNQNKVLVNKNEDSKPDVITSATKNNKDIPSNNKGNGNKTNSNTNNIAYSGNPNSIINTKNIFQVIDRDHSCIMNIHYVNYAVIVLREGCYNDYNFYINGKKLNAKRVNKEGTIVKIELDNRDDKKLTVEKTGQKQEMTLKYKNF